MRYLPTRYYGSVELDSSGGAGAFVVNSDTLVSSHTQGLLYGVSVRFDEGEDAGQEIDDLIVAIYDGKIVSETGEFGDEGLLFSSTIQDDVAHDDTVCPVREQFSDFPQAFSGGLVVVVTGTTNASDANPHFFHVCLQAMIGVPG